MHTIGVYKLRNKDWPWVLIVSETPWGSQDEVVWGKSQPSLFDEWYAFRGVLDRDFFLPSEAKVVLVVPPHVQQLISGLRNHGRAWTPGTENKLKREEEMITFSALQSWVSREIVEREVLFSLPPEFDLADLINAPRIQRMVEL